MKQKILLLTILLGAFILAGCEELQLGTQDEQVVCVPASDISKICEQLGIEPGVEDLEVIDEELDEIIGDVEEDVETLEETTDEGLGEITGEVVEEVEETTEEEIVVEEVIEADYTVTEGELLTVSETATDPDGDELVMSYSEPLDANGQWQTQAGDAGVYYIDIIASDGENSATKTITILVVQASNSAPTLEIADVEVLEGETVELSPVVADADGDEVLVTISDPVGDDGLWETGFDDAGEYLVTVTANDGENEVSKEVYVTVLNANRAPAITSLTAAQVEEGELITVFVMAQDTDGDELEISFAEPLDANGQWQTEIGDAGEYVVSVIAFDGELMDTKTISLSVNAVNQPPVIDAADVTVNEGETVELSVTVTDPEGADVLYTVSDPVGDDLVWETGYDDSGEYEVTIVASDGENEVSTTVIVTVLNVNRDPVFG